MSSPTASANVLSANPPLAATPAAASTAKSFRARMLIPLLLIVAAIAAYHNSFGGAFVFDDFRQIVNNEAVHHLSWEALAETDRPVSRLTIAVNYAAGGLDTRGYHAFNLLIHIVAGLLLFAVVRRLLESVKLASPYAGASHWLAGAIAVVWLVHPLQTESVTYVIQRDEALMGMFFLLTLYCGIRACTSRHPRGWSVAAVLACGFGMASKQVMVAAPIVVLLCDRVFFSASLRDALRERWGLYAGLASTWIVLALLLAGLSQQQFAGIVDEKESMTAWEYARTQPGVIVHYLRLVVWPEPLVFDYKWPVANAPASVAPYAAILLALLGTTIWALWRIPWLGFLGACFFLVLAPTSSIMPITDAAFEHRMYLPLAAVVALLVIGAHYLLRLLARRIGMREGALTKLECALLGIFVLALGVATVRRNDDYRSAIAMWGDTVAKRPGNPRAHNNLGAALSTQGRDDEAVAHYLEAVRLKPDYAEAHTDLGVALNKLGRAEEAEPHFFEAVRLNPKSAEAQYNLGVALLKSGRNAESTVHASEAARLDPRWPEAQLYLGLALAANGNIQGAIDRYFKALSLRPDYAEAQRKLGAALAKQGRTREAAAYLAQAARLQPGSAETENELGNALYLQGRFAEAISHYSEAVRLNPAFAEAHHNLGLAALELNDVDSAIAHFSDAVRLKGDYVKARNNLGILLYRKGRTKEAAAQFMEAVRVDPSFTEAQRNLDLVRSPSR